MSDALADLLALSPPLAPVATELAAHWTDAAVRREFAAREMLFAPADDATALYVLGDGRVKLTTVSGEGKELIIALLGRGDILGDLSPAAAATHRAFAETLAAGWAWSVPQETVRRTLAGNPRAALAVMQVHDARSRRLEQRLASLVFLEVPQRLAATLLELSAAPDDAVLLTHYDLAGLIGSTRETTTLILNKFRGAGWVELDKRKVRVCDRAGLTALATGVQTLDSAQGGGEASA